MNQNYNRHDPSCKYFRWSGRGKSPCDCHVGEIKRLRELVQSHVTPVELALRANVVERENEILKTQLATVQAEAQKLKGQLAAMTRERDAWLKWAQDRAEKGNASE